MTGGGTADKLTRAPPVVAIAVLNGLSVTRDGEALREADLANRRARIVLKVLAIDHGQRIATDHLIDVLWGDTPPPRAGDNVAVLVSRLRRTLGASAITGGRGGYSLVTGETLRLDLAEAERLGAEAETRLRSDEPALAAAAAAAALDILGDGALLPEEDGHWLDPARARVTAMLARTRHTAAAAALRTNDPASARTAAAAALVADGLDEVAARQLMLAHARDGEPARSLQVYEEVRAVLAETLGVDPASETQDVYLSVLNEVAAGEPGPTDVVVVRQRRDSDSTLVGRDAEVGRLTDAWARAVGGSPLLVLVLGEAGIGKTTLIDELAQIALATGGTLLRARCYETERSLFLQPVVEALDAEVAAMSPSAVAEFAGARAAPFAALFPHRATTRDPIRPHPGRGTAESERRQAYETVTTLLRRLSDRRPVLLLLDDLQHTGIATLELLHYLDRHAGHARLLVVAALRAEEGAEALGSLADRAQVIELGPLGAPAVGILADRAGLGSHAADIMARTRGHPLFVIETMRTLASGDAGIPESLREAILQRVRRAGPDAEALLRAAAVLGASFDPPVIAGLMQLPAPEAARRCEQLLTSRLVVVAGRSYEFAHDLVHEVLYATTPEPTRLSYHRAAADLLTGRPEAVAPHAAAIGDWPRAARAWLLAAEQAAGRNAPADAERLLNHALAAAVAENDLDLRARCHLARGRVREVLASYSEAEQDLRAAVSLARESGDFRLEMYALRELGGDTTIALNGLADCAALLNDALAIARTLADHVAEADVLSRLAVLAGSQLRFEESIKFAERALVAAHAADNERATMIALDGMKSSLAYLGDVERLAPVLDRLEPAVRRAGDMFLLQWTVFESFTIPFARGDWARATELVEAALALNQESGRTAYEGWFHSHLGWIERLQGQHAEAIASGRLALNRIGHQHYTWWNAFSHAMLATTLAEVGELDEAVTLLREGLQLADRTGTPAYRLRCLALLTQLTGSETELLEADALLADVSAPPGHAWLHGIDVYLAIATAHLDHGNLDQAENTIAPVARAGRTTGAPPVLAQTSLIEARCLAGRGDRPGALALLTDAQALAARHGMKHVAEQAVTRARLL